MGTSNQPKVVNHTGKAEHFQFESNWHFSRVRYTSLWCPCQPWEGFRECFGTRLSLSFPFVLEAAEMGNIAVES